MPSLATKYFTRPLRKDSTSHCSLTHSLSGQRFQRSSNFDLKACHAEQGRTPTDRGEIPSKDLSNRRTLSTSAGFLSLARSLRARHSLGDISGIQPPDQRTASFRPARVYLYLQIRLALRAGTYGSYLTSYRPSHPGSPTKNQKRPGLNPRSGTTTLCPLWTTKRTFQMGA
jgi:hypothetical protein